MAESLPGPRGGRGSQGHPLAAGERSAAADWNPADDRSPSADPNPGGDRRPLDERPSPGDPKAFAGPEPFGDRLAHQVESRRSALVVGFDPFPELMPPALAEQAASRCLEAPDDRSALEAAADAVARWGEELVEACAPHAAAVKLQLACFEQLRGPGWEAACRVARRARELGLLVIADAKRADIPTTMQAYGAALFGPLRLPGGREVPGLDADAATVNPYAGDDAVEALGRWLSGGRGAFVLVHTSNPSAGRFQQLELREGGTLAEAVARRVAGWASRWPGERGYGAVGAVIGATYPQVLAALRGVLRGAWVLLAGVGPQGGRVESLQAAFDPRGLGAVVAASRQVMAAWQQAPSEDWRVACARAASALRAAIEQVRRGRGG